MNTLLVYEGMTLFDAALCLYGKAEAIFDLLAENPSRLNGPGDALSPGTKLGGQKSLDANVTGAFKADAQRPNGFELKQSDDFDSDDLQFGDFQ